MLRWNNNDRKRLRALVVNHCANYSSVENECLPLECQCVMLNREEGKVCCKYFRSAVLPLDPILEAGLAGNEAEAVKRCAMCCKAFIPKSNRGEYCSDGCRVIGTRRKNRIRKQRERGNTR